MPQHKASSRIPHAFTQGLPNNYSAICDEAPAPPFTQYSTNADKLGPHCAESVSLPGPSSYPLLGPKYPLLGTIYPQLRVQGRSWYVPKQTLIYFNHLQGPGSPFCQWPSAHPNVGPERFPCRLLPSILNPINPVNPKNPINPKLPGGCTKLRFTL